MISHNTHGTREQEADTPLLTLSAVRALKASYDEDVRLLETLPIRIEEKRRKLDAAMLFLPPGVSLDQAPIATQVATIRSEELNGRAGVVAQEEHDEEHDEEDSEEGSGSRLTWVSGLERVLRESGRALTYKEALEEVSKTELGNRVSEGAKGFYRAIARLAEQGVLVKSGGLLIHADTARAMEEAGQELPVGPSGRIIGTSALILSVLEGHPLGLTGPQLREAVASHEQATKSVKEHEQYVFNIASGLVERGLVKKRGGVYRLAQKAKE